MWRYYIRSDRCRACKACLKACAADAIRETNRSIPDIEMHPSFRTAYEIDQTLCTRCGACMKTCTLRVITKKFALR